MCISSNNSDATKARLMSILANSAVHPTSAVNLRIRNDVRAIIDRAAKSHGKSRSEFMIDAARRAAEEALLDQTLVRVDQETYSHFLAVLDQPPSGEGFERLMRASKPWQV
jgi:uncharacterized protein (DUF1778 family)